VLTQANSIAQVNTTPTITLSHTNNYDFLRLMFATFVLVTHSYAMLGLPEIDVYSQWSHHQTSLSSTAVFGFFILSGLLITKSLLRSSSLLDYYYKRALRILPGLWVVLGVVAVLGFFISGKSFAAYFSHWSTRDYLIYGSMFRLKFYIDGVFVHNPIKAVNGSLWTIPYEISFYIFLSFSFFCRKNTRVLRTLFCALFLVLFYLLLAKLPALEALPEERIFSFKPVFMVQWGLFFVSGCILAVIPLPSTRTRNIVGWAALLLMLGSLTIVGSTWMQYLLLPIAVVYIGSLSYPIISNLRKLGDISYGTYLWGWPVQQTLVHFLHLSYVELVCLCIPLAWLMGYLSWKVIEEPALRLKLKIN
jgi:peptidoglycan/LPS O-acetylase OafA/YrhL